MDKYTQVEEADFRKTKIKKLEKSDRESIQIKRKNEIAKDREIFKKPKKLIWLQTPSVATYA